MDRTILENVLLPLEITGVKPEDAKKRAEEMLEKVGILEHKDKFPIQLSGGELQRAAIARALTLNPDVLLADEPTGNLDNKTAMAIVDLLSAINATGTTVIMATHNIDILEKYKSYRIVELQKGVVIRNTPSSVTVQVVEKKEEIVAVDEKETKHEEKKTEVKNEHKKEGGKKHGKTH